MARHLMRQQLDEGTDASQGVTFCALSTDAIASADRMTFPAHRHLLRLAATNPKVWAIEAHINGEMIGLVLADCLEDDIDSETGRAVATLRSVFVNSAWRNQGIGRELLAKLELELTNSGRAMLRTSYTTLMKSYRAVERILAANEWQEPKPNIYFCKGPIEPVLAQPWMKVLKRLPNDFEIFSWNDATAAELTTIHDDVQRGVVPDTLSPFYNEQEIEPTTSVGMRYQGSVIAWMITHPLAEDGRVLRYSRQFAYPPHDQTGRSMCLVAEALQRHAKSPIYQDRPWGMFDVPLNYEAMVRFHKRRLAPAVEVQYESRIAAKLLAQHRTKEGI